MSSAVLIFRMAARSLTAAQHKPNSPPAAGRMMPMNTEKCKLRAALILFLWAGCYFKHANARDTVSWLSAITFKNQFLLNRRRRTTIWRRRSNALMSRCRHALLVGLLSLAGSVTRNQEISTHFGVQRRICHAART